MNRLSQWLYTAVLVAAVAGMPVVAQAMGDEEFVGPFASWTNVRSYGAVGDGVHDDTAAIQAALAALGATAPTLYFPAGTYRISATLVLAAQQYVNLIGQGTPAPTVILWAGPAGGTMLDLDGIAYSRVDRLTFNGAGSAGVAVDQAWDGATGYFDTGNEYADDVFENAGTGMRCGALGYGCAETAMLRDQFRANSTAGVAMKNFNALDMFIWYSFFKDNADGVTNYPGAGNFHVYNSMFEDSTQADIEIGNTGLFNFRNNFSIDSNAFIASPGATNNSANITVEGNTILDTTSPISIGVWDLGPLVLIDNIVRSARSVSFPPGQHAVMIASFNPSDLFSMGNTFSVPSPTWSSGHYHSVQDQVVARSTINPPAPNLPGVPPNNHRAIFEVPPGASAAQIQRAITQAAASGSTKPVVHIPPGSYNIATTLVVPAASDLQIIGDGAYSRLIWSGAGAGPVIRLLGPSKATLRDFSVSGNGYSGNGIEVDDADQAGSRVFLEQANLGASTTNLFVDGLDYTNVELHDFYHEYDDAPGATSVTVSGGPSAAAGLWRGGATNIFAGASAGNTLSYNVSNGAHLAVRDLWYDSGGSQIAEITGTSTFSYAGSELNPAGPAILFDDFAGTAALVNLNTTGAIDISGTPTGRVLGLGLIGPTANFFANSGVTAEFLNGQTTANPPPGVATTELPEQGTPPNPALLSATLNQLRTEQPTLLVPLASGVTDARFYRVFVDSASVGIHLAH